MTRLGSAAVERQKTGGLLGRERLLLAFFTLGGCFCVLTPWYPHYRGALVLKILPALVLALLALLHAPRSRQKPHCVALLFSAAGDLALGLNDVWDGGFFSIGVGLFLVTQLLYSVSFCVGFKLTRSKLRWVLAPCVAVYSLGIGWVLRERLGKDALPVFVYIAVITTMAVLAVLRGDFGAVLVVGALMFMASDSLIVIHRFLTPVPASKLLIITTYGIAQSMITWGIVVRRR